MNETDEMDEMDVEQGGAASGGRTAPAPGGPLVLKVGSSSLTSPDGGIDETAVSRVVGQVRRLWEAGYPTVLVSSGAVASGAPLLGGRPTETTGLQVAAAVGQTLLIALYSRICGREGLMMGQVLLTLDILSQRSQYLHARRTLTRMLEQRIVPIVNENDTVAVDELKMGDNDRLAAIVAHLVGAGMLIMLTDTDGLYSADPRSGGGEPISVIHHRDPLLDRLAAESSKGPVGSGGVRTKVVAARMAAWSGIPTVIAGSGRPRVVESVVKGEAVGTYVVPGKTRLSARKLWMAFGRLIDGGLSIDEGAARALIRRGGSLLPVGITGVTGEFVAGAAVEVRGPDGALVAKGLASAGSAELRRWMGRRSSEIGQPREAVHRDQMVVLADD